MSSVRVYVSTKDVTGVYGPFIDVSKYVSKIGTIKIDADSNDYQLGVFRTSSVQVTLNNRGGIFSDTGQAQSMFPYSRLNSIVQVTWMEGEDLPFCGFARAGFSKLSPETVLFNGLLSDDSLKEDSSTEEVEFQILGYETLFDDVNVPFSALTLGDSVAQLIYKCLNQSPITNYLTVSMANFSLGVNLVPDVLDSLLNNTVKQALDTLLLVSNSVLYIQNGVIFVTSRAAAATVSANFYGQAAQAGLENTINVGNITSGLPRCLNYFFWTVDTSGDVDPSIPTGLQQSAASIAKYGVRSQEIQSELFTTLDKQNTILANLLAEFAFPKREFEITVRLDYNSNAQGILNRISVDYPTVFNPSQGFSLPVCGVAICGSSSRGPRGAVLPVGLWSLTLNPADNWKILSKQIDAVNEIITFKVRGI